MNSVSMKPGRNDPCPCGSGVRFKHCCGVTHGAAPRPGILNSTEIGSLVGLVNQGHLIEAEHGARTLLRVHPNDGMLWKILSVALMRLGKDAFAALRTAAQLMPNDAEVHGNLGTALHDRGEWAEALVSLRRALEIEPQAVEPLVDAANALKALGRAGEAIPFYERALQAKPQHLEARNNLGNAFFELGQCDDAARCYRLALEIKADEAQIHCNLGNVLRQLGSLDEAVTSSRVAILLDPKLGLAHNGLGLSLAALGQSKEAIACYRQALILNPSNVEALINLGNVLRDVGERREALSVYRQAVELDPGRAESHCNLGNVLLEFGLLEEAAESYQRALALQPGYAAAHVSLASVLRLQHRVSDAEANCQAALAIDPTSVRTLCLLGELRADRGQFAEAEKLFQQAISIDPNFPFAFFGIAKHRKMTSDDTAWVKGAETLLAKRPPLGHEICLRYAFGKYCDDVGQYDNAFRHYREANELTRRYGSRFDAAKLTRCVDWAISHFDAALVDQRQPGAASSERPVFIIGMPRSGTSLAEQILASHPAVFGAGELSFWDGAFGAYHKAQLQNEDGASLTDSMASDYLKRLTALSGELPSRVIDKMPNNFLYAGLIHSALPRARIIHMQRHPLDTCLSIYFSNFIEMGAQANDFDSLAHYYGEYARITNHWRAVLPAATLLEVPYEALVADPEGWSRRMLDFIGLPWDPKCLDFHQTERVVITASKWQVRQRINAASVGRWRNYEKFLGSLQRLVNQPTHP